jgi:streptogramin lyase
MGGSAEDVPSRPTTDAGVVRCVWRCLLVWLLAVLIPGAASAGVTEFAVTTPKTYPYDITAGPDGALWFTATRVQDEQATYFIGRITTAGSVREFPSRTVFPVGTIATGPDGALWFATVGKIGRITTAGRISEFPLPNAKSFAASITAGPDGAVWFTDPHTRKIGRISVPACRVPRLRGKTLKAAKRVIRRHHCAVGKVKRRRSSKVKRGRIISQRPKAGKRRPGGSRVNLTVSKG